MELPKLKAGLVHLRIPGMNGLKKPQIEKNPAPTDCCETQITGMGMRLHVPQNNTKKAKYEKLK